MGSAETHTVGPKMQKLHLRGRSRCHLSVYGRDVAFSGDISTQSTDDECGRKYLVELLGVNKSFLAFSPCGGRPNRQVLGQQRCALFNALLTTVNGASMFFAKKFCSMKEMSFSLRRINWVFLPIF